VPTAADGTASNKSTNRPHDVVESSDDTTVGRVRDFNDICGTSSSGDGDTESEEEATGHELTNTGVRVTCELNNDTDDNDPSTNGHTGTATPGVNTGSNERNSDDGTNLIHGGDDTYQMSTSRHQACKLIEKTYQLQYPCYRLQRMP
jgi:hypothetical protein